MRECYRCKTAKEETEFWSCCAYCIACDKAYRKEWRKRNKKEYRERRMVLWRQRKSRKCQKCGKDFVGKRHGLQFCTTKCKLLGMVVKKRNGCWEWQGYILPNGYGQTSNHETFKNEHAHRVSYRVFKEEIPEGLHVCHSCDNRKCINPEHLWLGTQKDNVRDAFTKGRMEHVKLLAAKGVQNGNAKLNDEKVREIRSELTKGIRCTVIARKYGVGSSVIYLIRDGKAWKHVK